MASYTKRGDGQWRVRVRKGNHPLQSKTFKNKALAQKWATQVESQMDQSIFLSASVAENTEFSDLITRYIDEILPTKKSERRATSTLNNIKTHLGHHKVAGLTPEILVQYRNMRMEKVKGHTVRKDLLAIRRMLVVASKEWGIYLPRGNPVDMITVPVQPTKGRDRRFEGDEEQRILKQAEIYGGEIKAIIQFATETGMRRGEIYDLLRGNVNIETRVATLIDTKNGDNRRVPLSPLAAKIIRDQPEHSNGKVFSMRKDSISQAFDRCAKRCDIENMRFHDLRHEATSRFFEKGFDIMQVSAITGHKDLSMLKRYTHLRAEDLAERLK